MRIVKNKPDTLTHSPCRRRRNWGSIKLTLWNEQIEQVNVGDNVKIENGYVTSFKGDGKFGKMTFN